MRLIDEVFDLLEGFGLALEVHPAIPKVYLEVSDLALQGIGPEERWHSEAETVGNPLVQGHVIKMDMFFSSEYL